MRCMWCGVCKINEFWLVWRLSDDFFGSIREKICRIVTRLINQILPVIQHWATRIMIKGMKFSAKYSIEWIKSSFEWECTIIGPTQMPFSYQMGRVPCFLQIRGQKLGRIVKKFQIMDFQKPGDIESLWRSVNKHYIQVPRKSARIWYNLNWFLRQ